MPKDLLDLRCDCCDLPPPAVSAKTAAWVSVRGHSAEWLDLDSTRTAGREWRRSDACPEPDTRRYVKVPYPFSANRDAPFWLLFMPGLASENGWCSHPETIPESAFVRCSLIEVLEREKSSAWISVAIDDVVKITELERNFHPMNGPLPALERHQTVERARFHEWEAIEGSSEGDVGVWFIARHSLQKVHLLVEGKWSFHEDEVYAGNLELTEEQWSSLCDGMQVR